jgi:signal transduction histidine kinase
MSLLLDDVLMIGRSEAGKLNVSLTRFPLVPFLKSLALEVEESRRTHTIVTEFNCAKEFIVTDEKLMRTIIINLLTNAIKFSPQQTRIEFQITCDDRSFFITVRDFGVGIPEADWKNLFEPFHRGANVNEIQGTGLGLSLVKKTVDVLGGTISFASTLSHGTTFQVSLPVDQTVGPDHE